MSALPAIGVATQDRRLVKFCMQTTLFWLVLSRLFLRVSHSHLHTIHNLAVLTCTSNMPFRLEIAQPDDIARITRIHMAAFSSNALICAIHSADKDLKDWRKSVERKALVDIHDAKTTVLVVLYQQEDKAELAPRKRSDDIVGFAKWTHPFRLEDGYRPPPWEVPENTDQRILSPWLDEVQKVEAEIIGETPRYGKELTIHNVLKCTHCHFPSRNLLIFGG